ncbi:hypothetical protein ZIOFF_057021 [Zingiber officinale]|uniref:Uncharacterized protein n=1 Tax=Zingiber officinale TaxID=94328 RepID=A0A8J5FHQ7_ZINOF|nr:hypothetical protein ZIOFF_057021 [Zingiber officinale]
MVSRREQVSQREHVPSETLYSTKLALVDSGKEHEIMIRCKGDELNAKESELYVEVNKKEVVSVRRLRWNFKGNQAIFIYGSSRLESVVIVACPTRLRSRQIAAGIEAWPSGWPAAERVASGDEAR